MGKSRSQKLIEAAMLIQNNCQGLKDRGECQKCIFKDNDGYTTCLLDIPGKFAPYNWIIPRDKVKAPLTRADAIRAMRNDELAKVLSMCGCEFCIINEEECMGDVPCAEGIRAWLAQEVGCDD